MLGVSFELLRARFDAFAAQVWLSTTMFGAQLAGIGLNITLLLIIGFISCQSVVYQFLL
jgi:hypothetical protein